MKPDMDRVKAIQCLENPKNQKELQRILGVLNYLRKFIPNYAEMTKSLRELLKKNLVFEWNQNHTNEFNKIKDVLSTQPVLGNFDSNKAICIQTDASKDGIGCCLLQEKRPIYHASRSLTDCEKRYAQCEKEFLAVTFACKKFHNLIYG